MSSLRLAVIADVHGGAMALEAVRAEIRAAAPDLILDLGDRLSGPLQPEETAQIFDDLGAMGVRGNHDRALATTPRARMGPSDAFAHDAVSADRRAALGALPFSLIPCDGVLAFHASPRDDATYLHERIVEGRLIAMEADEIDAAPFEGFRLALCGHSHRPYASRLANGCVLVNPGSVGCPAYDDDDPPHVSESGSPDARWALIELGTAGVTRVDLRAVAYDAETAARLAERNGRPDWGHALRTGRSLRAQRRGKT